MGFALFLRIDRLVLADLDTTRRACPCRRDSWWREWRQTALPVAVTLGLLALGLANVVSRATSDQVEDGVLWIERAVGVVAAEVASPSAASRAGVRPGDVLLAIDNRPVDGRADVLAMQQEARAGERHSYTLLRLGSREVTNVALTPMPSGEGLFYYVLAAVGIFTLLVGAAVRARRPTDQATLHFFWLSVAFFGVFTFSFSGRLDRVDWVFYWGDAIAVMVLPPLFLHFTLVFPERPHVPGYSAMLARWLPAIYLPGAVLGSTRALAIVRSSVDPQYFVSVISLLDRLEYVYLAIVPRRRAGRVAARAVAGALGDDEAPVAVDRVGHRARRRPVRARLRAAVRVRRRSLDSDGAVRDSAGLHPAGVRLGHHPLPLDGRRDHPQAPADLHLRRRRDRRHLRADPARVGRLGRRRRSRAPLDHRLPRHRRRHPAGQAGERRPAEGHRSRVLSRSL